MMSITDFKLADADFAEVDVKALPDRPSEAGINAAKLKATFDHVAEKLVSSRLNSLIDALISTGGAAEIGVEAIEGVAGLNAQQMLEAVKTLIDDRYTKAQADALLATKFDAAEAVSLVHKVAFNAATGVFTLTNYDGSTYTLDTALAKVALDVRLEGQQFVLTLVDGSEQRVDLSTFITQTEFDDSTTILFTVSAGRVSAGIKPSSLQLSHFDPEALAVLDAKKDAAAASAEAAAASASNSQTSAAQSAAKRQRPVRQRRLCRPKMRSNPHWRQKRTGSWLSLLGRTLMRQQRRLPMRSRGLLLRPIGLSPRRIEQPLLWATILPPTRRRVSWRIRPSVRP